MSKLDEIKVRYKGKSLWQYEKDIFWLINRVEELERENKKLKQA